MFRPTVAVVANVRKMIGARVAVMLALDENGNYHIVGDGCYVKDRLRAKDIADDIAKFIESGILQVGSDG